MIRCFGGQIGRKSNEFQFTNVEFFRTQGTSRRKWVTGSWIQSGAPSGLGVRGAGTEEAVEVVGGATKSQGGFLERRHIFRAGGGRIGKSGGKEQIRKVGSLLPMYYLHFADGKTRTKTDT